MPITMHDIMHPGSSEQDERFVNAPAGWTRAYAETLAQAEGLTLSDDHWEVIRVIQGVWAEDQSLPIRLVHDALDTRFASQGGARYLYSILPGGPIAQGCRLAGLTPPVGSVDSSFGSVS